jgi:hypothetical protein
MVAPAAGFPFVVPVPTESAVPTPRYFERRSRGIGHQRGARHDADLSQLLDTVLSLGAGPVSAAGCASFPGWGIFTWSLRRVCGGSVRLPVPGEVYRWQVSSAVVPREAWSGTFQRFLTVEAARD